MKNLIGIVKSDKMDKTVVVEVERKKPHPLYRKIVRKKKRYKADKGEIKVKIGDKVVIEQTRPLSKDKRWRVIKNVTA